MKKSTQELLNVLRNVNNIEEYVSDENDEIVRTDIATEISNIVQQKEVKPADLFRLAGIERTYGYEILSGEKKNPSRDKVLALLFALNTSFEDVQRILKATGYPPLYARVERDSVIIFALQRQISLLDTNELLDEMGMEYIR